MDSLKLQYKLKFFTLHFSFFTPPYNHLSSYDPPSIVHQSSIDPPSKRWTCDGVTMEYLRYFCGKSRENLRNKKAYARNGHKLSVTLLK